MECHFTCALSLCRRFINSIQGRPLWGRPPALSPGQKNLARNATTGGGDLNGSSNINDCVSAKQRPCVVCGDRIAMRYVVASHLMLAHSLARRLHAHYLPRPGT